MATGRGLDGGDPTSQRFRGSAWNTRGLRCAAVFLLDYVSYLYDPDELFPVDGKLQSLVWRCRQAVFARHVKISSSEQGGEQDYDAALVTFSGHWIDKDGVAEFEVYELNATNGDACEKDTP